MDASITSAALRQSLASAAPPLVIDVRKRPAFLDAQAMIRGALRRNPLRVCDWARTLPQAACVVVYDALYRWCKEGKNEAHTWNPGAYR